MTLGLCVLAVPLFVIDVPPLLDYPNHLARALVLSGKEPMLWQFYRPVWSVIPNLGTDLVLPQLVTWLPVHIAGRLILAFILILPVIGAIAYSRALFGRFTAWSLGSLLVAYNGTFLLGFMNFEMGIGLALLFAAAWVRFRETQPATTIILCSLGTTALFFCHLIGVLAFLLLVGANEITRPNLLRRALLAFPLVLAPALLFLLSPLQGVQTEILFQSASQKLLRAAMALLNYNVRLDVASAILVLAAVVVLLARRRLIIPASSLWALGLCALLYLASPFTYKGTLFLDIRFAVLFGFLLFAGIRPRSLPPGLAIAAALLFLTRTFVVADTWCQHRADLAQIRAAIAPVTPGSRVLLATVSEEEAPAAWQGPLSRQLLSDGTRLDLHTGALLLIERQAFWPFLFAEPSQQPVELRAPYSQLAAETLNAPNVGQLLARKMLPADQDIFPLEGHWACCYDYVLLMESSAAPGFSQPNLQLLVSTDYASLFKVINHSQITQR